MIRTRRLLPLSLLAVALLVVGCAEEPSTTIPSFYRNLGTSTALVDSAMAANMISAYRANNGLAPVTVDPVLEQVAADQARIMAARDNVNASLDDSRDLEDRLTRAGYTTTRAVENVSAGYRTLAEAFSGWRESKSHNAKLLDPAVRRIGIATAYAPTSKYQVYWSVILAADPAS